MKIPSHLGIILDGNRRWATEKGLPVFLGHKEGAENVKKIINVCKAKGIKTLTLFVFSTENWSRPRKEVDFLMNLGKKEISHDFESFAKDGIRIRIIGDRKKIRKDLLEKISELEKKTQENDKMTVNLALSYGGRAEITSAIREIIKKKIAPEKITEEIISQNLWTSDLDLLIRTGKEQRISNFLIWQAAYSELYFCKKYWPDFTEKDLDRAFLDYTKRQRRFGA